MTVVVTGASLSPADVVSVARRGEPVVMEAEAVTRMKRARELADALAERGTPTYGLTTGLGVQKRARQDHDDVGFQWRQIAESRAGVGPLAPPGVVRAAMLILLNQMAGGSTCLRPLLAERLAQALNDGMTPSVRLRGSLGASDLAPMADLAAAVFAGVDLVAGEGLAVMNSGAFGTGVAALALADAARLVDAADVAAALSLEGFAANPSTLHPAIELARPDPVLARTLAHLRELLRDSFLWREGAARNLQDPLTYRSTAPLQATAHRALEHAQEVLDIEMNSAQGNPLVSLAAETIVSAGAYEVAGLSAALDYVRIALASMLTAASERSLKLLDTPWSGLPTGLLDQGEGGPDLGLSILAITAESLAAEASTLAQPVSFVLTSTSGAEGIEDRASQLPLSARRLAEQVDAGEAIVAIELVVAAQAVDLRGSSPLGRGTARAHRRLREVVPVLRAGGTPPVDVEPVIELLRDGPLA
ncbi:MAG: aromatic amino acid lyase [Actinobacteria bacterium]|nr:aromatic amino acid lyase [Actinomycetota bacterium]